jgi:hypothetical protein
MSPFCIVVTVDIIMNVYLLLPLGTMLKNCILILPVSDPAKQADQVVKHHVFDERTVIT